MELPAYRSLGWTNVLSIDDDFPPHLRLSFRDTRYLLQTLVALDTIDGENLGSGFIERPDFPMNSYHELLALTDRDRDVVRADLRRMFLPTNKMGRLVDLLPIDILIDALANTGKKPLFLDSDVIHQPAKLLNILPTWQINSSVTTLLPTHALCVEINSWLKDPVTKHNLFEAIAKRRRHTLQTFNNRRSPMTNSVAIHGNPPSQSVSDGSNGWN